VRRLEPVRGGRGLVDHLLWRGEPDASTSPASKTQLRSLQATYWSLAAQRLLLPSVWDVGLSVFWGDDEDGVIHFPLAAAGAGSHREVSELLAETRYVGLRPT
jgi:hypothetical protein